MDIYEHQSSCAELKPVAIDVDADVNVGTGLGLITPEIAHSSTPSLLHPPLIHASSSTSATPATTTPTTYPASKLSVSRPPSPSLSASHLSVKNEHGGARAPSILSRHSSRAPSIQHVAATAAVLISNPTARRLRMNVYSELVRGWYYLSTSSKILLSYYIMATMVEIIVTITVVVIERKNAHECSFLIIFLALYLTRAIVICVLLLRRFLYVRPDDLPRDLSRACGAHYNTMTNLASLLLLLVSISLLTTQAHCAQDAPGLFYLVLALSSMGYLYLATLLLLWFVVLFCLNGLVIVLELFGVGSRVMQWEGATQDMLDEVPIIKFTKHDLNSASPVQDREEGSPSSSDEKSTAMPSIVVSDDSAGVQSGRQDSSGIVVIDMRQTSRVEESNPVSLTTNLPDTEENIGNMLTFDHLSSEERELAVRISTSCSICLCDYEDLEELRHLPCDHYFHKECVDEWLKLKRTCPLCKYDISRTNRGAKRWSRRSNRHQTSGSDGARGSRRFSLRR